ncbi:MAG: ATP-binding protein [Proteobacteria bacterium]|nr:ATP-binding protein [Pseudomonadota bacterium]
MENLNFTVDSALLSELGEKLVETVYIALVELVKNSYDADASIVAVKFTEREEGLVEIHIEDDGSGMNFHDVERYWMKIATTNKMTDNVSPKYGRPRTGSKGIGRFCCRRLGRSLTLFTTGKKDNLYQTTKVQFPWRKFKAGTSVTSIDCPGDRSSAKTGATKTTLIISELVDEWNNRNYEVLKRQLSVLVANRGARRNGFQDDPGFNIKLEAPQFEGGIRDLREDLINAGWGTLSAYINKKHQAVCELNAMGIGRKTVVSSQIFSNLGDISVKLGILVDDKSQVRDKSMLSLGSLREILPEWGGVQVRQRGFRVFPYGDDDWLDIDSDRGLRKTTPKDELYIFAQTLEGIDPGRSLLNMLSMRSYVGDVEIGSKASGFEMKASREGFIRSAAFEELKLFVRFVIQWATIYREYHIRNRAKDDAEAARVQLEEILDAKIEPGRLVESAVDYLQKEAKTIVAYLPATHKKEFKASFNKATEAILKHDKDSKDEVRHLRLVASTSTLLLIFSHEVKSLLGLLEQNQSALGIIENKLKSQERKIVKEIRDGLTETKIRFDELLNMTSLIGIDSRHVAPATLALRERIERAGKAFQLIMNKYSIDLDYKDVPNNVVINSILEAELYAILLNALSNSIKSVIAAGGDKGIKISAKREQGRTIIRIMDTGIGINPSYYEEVFIPFIADPEGKLYKHLSKRLNPEDKYIVGTGSGLGLSIVKEIVQVRKGSISFHAPKGDWKAELEIILP